MVVEPAFLTLKRDVFTPTFSKGNKKYSNKRI